MDELLQTTQDKIDEKRSEWSKHIDEMSHILEERRKMSGMTSECLKLRDSTMKDLEDVHKKIYEALRKA